MKYTPPPKGAPSNLRTLLILKYLSIQSMNTAIQKNLAFVYSLTSL